MTCVRAQHARFIYHGPDNALKCSDCNIVEARENEKETERKKKRVRERDRKGDRERVW